MLSDFGESRYATGGSYGFNPRESTEGSDQNGLYGNIYGDSSAAIAVSQRRSCGKLRHINIGQLWIQEKGLNKELAGQKVHARIARPAC